MSTLTNDIKYGLRQLRKRPGFTIAALLTLALGLTINTLVFSTISGFYLRPLPVPNSEDLVVIGQGSPNFKFTIPCSYLDFQDFRQAVENPETESSPLASAFSGIMAYSEQPVHLSRTNEGTERGWIHAVSNNYFSVLDIKPQLGRFFLPSEGIEEGADPIIVITYNTWQRRFHASIDIVGKTVKLNGLPFTVIGVTPPDFHGASFGLDYSGFVTASMIPQLLPRRAGLLHGRGDTGFFMMGRMRPGVPFAQAQKAISLFMSHLVKTYPGYHAKQGYAVTMKERNSRPSPHVASFAPFIVSVLMGMALLVLIVAMANVANLLFARAAGQQHEIAIRGALGASRGRLLRQILVESVLLALGAGIVGMLLVLGLMPVLDNLAPSPTAPAADMGVDWRLFIFTFCAALLAGVCTGFIPALKATKLNVVPALKDSNYSQIGSRHPWRSLMVTSQVSLTVIVLICAGLAVRSMQRLSQVPLGYRSNNLLLASFDLGMQRYTQEQGRRFQTQLLEKIHALPQVTTASLTHNPPFSVGGGLRGDIVAEGKPQPEDSRFEFTACTAVDHHFFETTDLSIVHGRAFSPHDQADSPRVAIINQILAQHLWPEESALGQRLRIGGRPHEVVGIIGTCRYYSMMEDNRPLVFRPLAQNYNGRFTLIAHSPSAAAALRGTVQQIVRQLDPDLPLYDVKTIEQHIADSPVGMMPMRMGATMAGIQGVLSLLLAALGITGLVSFAVAQRTREIGIRIAMGAKIADVLKLVTSQSLRLISIGLILGVVLSLGITQILSNVLYDVSPRDPVVFLSVILLTLGATLIASWLPARRATKTDPMKALRYE